MFDFSLIVSMLVSLFFTPFLSYLVLIQSQNFAMNQTTNTRFSKHPKKNATEQAIAQLAECEASDAEDDSNIFTASSDSYQPMSMAPKTRTFSRVSSLDQASDQGCAGNCSNMFCGVGHFRKQERIMRKFADDSVDNILDEIV